MGARDLSRKVTVINEDNLCQFLIVSFLTRQIFGELLDQQMVVGTSRTIVYNDEIERLVKKYNFEFFEGNVDIPIKRRK
jgi:hypothetical protein